MTEISKIEHFSEMLERAIEMYETARRQIAPAHPAGFQEGLDRLTLWQTLNNIMNYYRVPENDREDIRYHLRREVEDDQRRKTSAVKAEIAEEERYLIEEREAIQEDSRPWQFKLALQ